METLRIQGYHFLEPRTPPESSRTCRGAMFGSFWVSEQISFLGMCVAFTCTKCNPLLVVQNHHCSRLYKKDFTVLCELFLLTLRSYPVAQCSKLECRSLVLLRFYSCKPESGEETQVVTLMRCGTFITETRHLFA